MIWLKRTLLIIASILFLSIVGIVISSVYSLDKNYTHTKETKLLPALSDSTRDGLVRITTNKFEFRARVAGLNNDSDALILLHGFPETSIMWVPLIEAAKQKGFRIVAFDQRGYSPGARPKGYDAYTMDRLMNDISTVADEIGFKRFHLVGHDWGAVVGWSFAAKYPDRLLSWTALSIPHPEILLDDIVNDTPAYIRFFQTPWLPELTFTFNNMKKAKDFFEGYPTQQSDEYLAVFSEPGALTATLNWYRALDESYKIIKANQPMIRVPVLFIWGKHDFYARWANTSEHKALINNNYNELELDTGHFLIQSMEKEVIQSIISHLQNSAGV